VGSHGAIDMIVDRREMREKLSSLLSMLSNVEAPARPEPEEVFVAVEDSVSADETDAPEPAVDESTVSSADTTLDGSEASQQVSDSSQADPATLQDQGQSVGEDLIDKDDKSG